MTLSSPADSAGDRLTKDEFLARCATILRRMAAQDEGLVVAGLRRYLAKNTAPGGRFAPPVDISAERSDEDLVEDHVEDVGAGESGDGQRQVVAEVEGQAPGEVDHEGCFREIGHQ